MSTLQAKQACRTGPLKVITMADLLEHDFQRREYLLHPWLRQGESAMVWAQTGLGKTMLTLTMALAVGGGGSFLNWTNTTPRRVLLVDGEMHCEDLKDRLLLLAPSVANLDLKAAGRNVHVLSRQFQNGGVKFPDLASEPGQRTVRLEIAKVRAELVIIDNFSTCAEIADENEASAMNPVLSFLLSLKQQGTACILVHHSGKTGSSFRGSSKLATTFEAILGLKPYEGAGAGCGTAFETEWTKFRGQPHAGVRAAMVRLVDGPDGLAAWTSEASDTDSIQLLVSTALSCEYATGDAIAVHLGWSKSKVTKVKQKAIRAGRFTEEDWKRCLRDAEQDGAGGSTDF